MGDVKRDLNFLITSLSSGISIPRWDPAHHSMSTERGPNPLLITTTVCSTQPPEKRGQNGRVGREEEVGDKWEKRKEKRTLRAEIKHYFGTSSPKISGTPWTLWPGNNVCQCCCMDTQQHTLGLILIDWQNRMNFSVLSTYCRSHTEAQTQNSNVRALLENSFLRMKDFKLAALDYYWQKMHCCQTVGQVY